MCPCAVSFWRFCIQNCQVESIPNFCKEPAKRPRQFSLSSSLLAGMTVNDTFCFYRKHFAMTLIWLIYRYCTATFGFWYQVSSRVHRTFLGTITMMSVVPVLITTVMQPVLTVLVIKPLVVQVALRVLRGYAVVNVYRAMWSLPFLMRLSSHCWYWLWLCVSLQVKSQPSEIRHAEVPAAPKPLKPDADSKVPLASSKRLKSRERAGRSTSSCHRSENMPG